MYVFPINNSAYKNGTASIVPNFAAEAAVEQKAATERWQLLWNSWAHMQMHDPMRLAC